MALRARAWPPRNPHRTQMPRVAGDTISDRAIGVRFSHAMALLASTSHRGCALCLDERMRRPPCASRLIRLRKIDLLRRQPLLPIDRRPGRRSMPAMQILLIYAFVATPAVSRGQLGGNHEPVMIFLVLACGRLMAIEAIHPFLAMHAHFVLVHHRVLRSCMALGTLPCCSYQFRARLFALHLRPCAIHQKRRQNQRKRNQHRKKYGFE